MANHSLRKKLLLWLVVPLLILIAIDSTLLYRIATHFQREAFDHSLYDDAINISELIIESQSTQPESAETVRKQFHLRPEVRQAILSNQFDQMYYSIIDTQGQVIGGDVDLKLLPFPHARGVNSSHEKARYAYSRVGDQLVRMVSIYVAVNTQSGFSPVYVQVAETLHRRNSLARDILIGIVVPQLVLVLVAVGLMWLGIGRGLQPLWVLHDALARRSYRDFSPVELPDTPVEVKVLVDSVNLLMQQLKNVLESQNRFIADAAHELRTPLAGMQAQLELAQDENDPHELQKSLAKTAGSIERLSHLVNQLLMLARNQPEVMRTLVMHPVNLAQLAQNVTMDMVPTALLKGTDLGFDGHGEPLFTNGDAQRLKELLYNLIDNAIRYSPQGSKVTVSVSTDADTIVLNVIDNGPGIPEEERDNVFERFHRVIGSQQDGSGLGLAIVMEIAQIHAASVSLAENAAGKGISIAVKFEQTAPADSAQ